MKKIKYSILVIIFISIAFSFTPPVTPQVGTYTFHGAPGNQKILRVRTVNNASLEDLFGANWDDVLESNFGEGSINVGAGLKSVVVSVNTSDKLDLTGFGLGIANMTTYVTNTWNWTIGDFSATPDNYNATVSSFYDPTTLSSYIHSFWALFMLDVNVSVQNAALYLTQLPTPVNQYLEEIIWEDQWDNVGNTIVHHAFAGNYSFLGGFQYLEDCTEVWSYDATFGAFIGYKIEDNETNTIYEYSIELSTEAAIPGFELPIFLGLTGITSIGMIYIVMKKKKVN